jgi:hypothetical protein
MATEHGGLKTAVAKAKMKSKSETQSKMKPEAEKAAGYQRCQAQDSTTALIST